MKNKKYKVIGEDGKEWSTGELVFMTSWRQVAPGLPEPKHDEPFHPSRGWRFDFVWLDEKVAVEVEGGIWAKGRHVRGTGYEGDCEKYNAALDLGYAVYRYSTEMLERDPFGCISQVASAVQKRMRAGFWVGVDSGQGVDESACAHVCGDCRHELTEVRPGKYQC